MALAYIGQRYQNKCPLLDDWHPSKSRSMALTALRTSQSLLIHEPSQLGDSLFTVAETCRASSFLLRLPSQRPLTSLVIRAPSKSFSAASLGGNAASLWGKAFGLGQDFNKTGTPSLVPRTTHTFRNPLVENPLSEDLPPKTSLSEEGRSTSDLRSELKAAVKAVERACQLCLNVRAGIHDDGESDEGDGRLKKQDATPVTVADFGVQALISLELRRLFPDVPLLGEEDATQLRDQLKTEAAPAGTLAQAVSSAVASVAPSDLGLITVDRCLDAIDDGRAETASQRRYWILDPIDGTRGFLRGGEAQYVIALALVEDGEVVLGVCGCPNMSAASLNCNTCTAEGPIGEPSSEPSTTDGGAKSSCFENGAPLGEDRRGIVVYASHGQGTWVRGLRVSDDGRAAASEPSFAATNDAARDTCRDPNGSENGADERLEAVRVTVDDVERLWDARICISDHESWGELPLAAALASTPHPEDIDDEGGQLHHADEWQAKQLPLCCGSICKYIAVALGAASVFVQHPIGKPSLKVWDHAAALICVLEAGGQVTDFDGRPLSLGNGNKRFEPGGGGVIVTNGKLHNQTLATVQKGQALLAGGQR